PQPLLRPIFPLQTHCGQTRLNAVLEKTANDFRFGQRLYHRRFPPWGGQGICPSRAVVSSEVVSGFFKNSSKLTSHKRISIANNARRGGRLAASGLRPHG